MVLSRNDKRKRKEGDTIVDLMDPLSEAPKRTKIHAQRKFAQGVATPVFSPISTPVKEKEKAKPAVFTELITHKRPNTEDFLTFLCFRGTSVLPPSLNFFGIGSETEKLQNGVVRSPPAPATTSKISSKTNGVYGKHTSSSKAENKTSAASTSQKLSTKPKISNDIKKQTPNIPKKIKLKTANTAIQALKKKYKEQRLAKQLLKKKFKPSCIKTRSGTNTLVQAPVKSVKAITVAKKIAAVRDVEKKRRGLRSTGMPESEKKSLPLRPIKKQPQKKLPPGKIKKKILISKEDASSVDSFSLKNSAKKLPAKVVRSKPIQKKIIKKSKKLEIRRVTRSRTETSTPTTLTDASPARRPSRKTKEAAAIYMEILGRKLVSPDLENDDNMSVDSFPELPNAKKIAQTEKEIKAKVKSFKVSSTSNVSTSISKEKDKDKEKEKEKEDKEKEKDKERERNKEKVKEKEKDKKKEKLKEKKAAATRKLVKKKVVKEKLIIPATKKRVVKVQKYREVNSDDDSMTSDDLLLLNEAIKASTATRRSAPSVLNKDKEPEIRGLRSSRSLVATTKSFQKSSTSQKECVDEFVKPVKSSEIQNLSKVAKESNNIKETIKEKVTPAFKRKREEKQKEKEKERERERNKDKDRDKLKSTPKKSEVSKCKPKLVGAEEESEEESLGEIINKIKKKKASEKENKTGTTKKAIELKNSNITEVPDVIAKSTTAETSKTKKDVETTKATPMPVPVMKSVSSTATTTIKVSDDEESFRGFTKKSMEICQSNSKTNNLLVGIDSKVNLTKTQNTLMNSIIGLKDVKTSATTFPCAKLTQDHILDEKKSTITKVFVKLEPESKASSSPKTVNVIDMPKSFLHSRKERVNMSNEQIEKWLNESSLAKEESKAEMEKLSNHSLEKNKHNDVPPPVHNHLLISPKIQHLVRPVNVTLSKLSDRLKKASMSPIRANRTSILLGNNHSPMIKPQLPTAIKPKLTEDSSKDNKKEERKEVPPCTPPSRKLSKDSSFNDADSDVISKSDANSISDSAEKKSISSPEKKVFFHQRKPFLPKVKERKPTTSASAFSPENESSVYAFETETETPVNTPFRRKARDIGIKDPSNKDKATRSQSSNSEVKSESGEDTAKTSKHLNYSEEARKDEEKSPPLLERKTPQNFELPKNFTDLTNVQVLPLDKLTTSWSNVNCSTSIAVQVNFDEQKQQRQQTAAESDNDTNLAHKGTEISTQTDRGTVNDDDDDSGQLFYIPLQAVTRNGSTQGGQHLIQGVAVKLGTEGPTGPNQRVLLKAKLVTKPPVSVARCPPIGTVQPTARTPQSTAPEPLDLPSTSNVEIFDDDELKITDNKQSKTNLKTPNTEKIIKSSKIKERKMSSDGTKLLKKAQTKSKYHDVYSPINNTQFPRVKFNEEARLVEAPTFRPTEKDFQDPLEYIEKIRPIAEKFGICKVVPPSNFKPECKVSDDMRFTAYNQYIHRMLHRWGPNVKEMMAIKKYLATQSISLTQPPWIGGMEVDLPHLYQTVQNLGGLKEVIEKKKWQKVADGMKIPRSAQDRVTKLDDIYCKYLLPYDTLSQDERDKLFKDVEADWKKREKRERQETQSNDNEDDDDDDNTEELEECIVKGRNMPLNAFYRIARNTQRMWFGENQRSSSGGAEMEDTSADEVEAAFWKHVVEKKRHVCVHSASIDSSGRGFGFSVAKNSPFGRHPWNLKILTNNAGSVLRALGPQMGVTVPTLHVGMIFSACCWYRDPHGLPWIEYLHTGAKKIWYGIPNELNTIFRGALTKMFPRYCKNKTIWLPSDTAMVPPEMLVANGVPLCQTVQEPGQFIVVFPKAFTSSICTGYVVSESVYFAQMSWLKTAEEVFKDLHDSCEPSIFSFERLLFSIINDSRSHIDVLKQILPIVMKICDKEIENRKKLKELGLLNIEKISLPENEKKGKGKKVKEDEGDYECDTCRANLFVSLVSNPTDGSIFCLTHAIQYIEKKKQVLKNCTLMYSYNESELNDLVHKLTDRIEAKSKKTNQTKQTK